MTSTLKYLISTFAIITILIPFQSFAKWYQHTFNTMGTLAHIEFWLDKENTSASYAQKLISEVMDEMDRLDKSMSPYIESSELSLLNRDTGNIKVVVSK